MRWVRRRVPPLATFCCVANACDAIPRRRGDTAPGHSVPRGLTALRAHNLRIRGEDRARELHPTSEGCMICRLLVPVIAS